MQKPIMEKITMSGLKQQAQAEINRLAQTAAAGETGLSADPFGYREEDAPANSEDEGPGGNNPTLRPGEQVGSSDDDDEVADDSSDSMNEFVVGEDEVAEEQRAAEREVAVEEERELELGKGRGGRKRLQRLQRAAGSGGGGGSGGGRGDGRAGDGLEDDLGVDGGEQSDGEEQEEEGGEDAMIASEEHELSLRAFAGNGKEEDVLPCYLEYLLRAALDPDWAQVGTEVVMHREEGGLGVGCLDRAQVG